MEFLYKYVSSERVLNFPMNPKSFNKALQYYFNLSYHRGVILEGIRLVAYRNMGHFNRAREKCGVPSINKHENIASIHDQMITEQEKRVNNRVGSIHRSSNRRGSISCVASCEHSS